MAFESLTTEELVRIASFGGGFSTNASGRTTEDLVRIASFTAARGARVVFRGISHRPVDEIVRIASFGKGCVSFDD